MTLGAGSVVRLQLGREPKNSPDGSVRGPLLPLAREQRWPIWEGTQEPPDGPAKTIESNPGTAKAQQMLRSGPGPGLHAQWDVKW